MKDHLIHYFKEHKKDLFYFVLIYTFSIMPVSLCLLALSKHMDFSPEFLLAISLSGSVPAGLYTEYSYRKLGYQKVWLSAIWTYFFMVIITMGYLVDVFIENLMAGFWIYFWAFLAFYLLGLIYFKDDRCSCPGQSKTAP